MGDVVNYEDCFSFYGWLCYPTTNIETKSINIFMFTRAKSIVFVHLLLR